MLAEPIPITNYPCAACGKAWREIEVKTETFRVPDCSCGVVPCVVLDPFGGSGTVGEVARELGRSAILIEIKAEYVGMIRKRVGTVSVA